MNFLLIFFLERPQNFEQPFVKYETSFQLTTEKFTYSIYPQSETDDINGWYNQVHSLIKNIQMHRLSLGSDSRRNSNM